MNIKHGFLSPAWVNESGPSDDIVISTRARLARNIQACPFPTRAREADLKRTAEIVLDAVHSLDGRMGKLAVVYPSHLSEAERLALVNTRLASRQHVDGGPYRPMVLNDAGTLSLMVNEEDHLRIQCILPGLQPAAALQAAQEFDNLISGKIEYARTDNYGYLTSSLANLGTGFRLSVMLHLVGLAYAGEVVSTLSAAAELKISVRGLLGEGTKGLGDVFQVSNETTMGFSEREIMSRVRGAAEHLISRERETRRKLAVERKGELAEAVEKVKAILAEASILGGREAMQYVSILRLGSELGLCPGISAQVFNELLVSMRLGDSLSGGAESIGSDTKRARMVREKLRNPLLTKEG